MSDHTITINSSDNSVFFTGGIDTDSMAALSKTLRDLETKLFKKQSKLKRKLDTLTKTRPNKIQNTGIDDPNIDEIDEIDDFEEFTVIAKPKNITLYISSYGGSVYAVFSAIDTIKNLKINVDTVCTGFVASAGTLLSLAGKRRYITKNSYMLIHELRSMSWGKMSTLTDNYQNSVQIMDHIKSYYVEHTRMTLEELELQLVKDQSWNAETCLAKGLVDQIL